MNNERHCCLPVAVQALWGVQFLVGYGKEYHEDSLPEKKEPWDNIKLSSYWKQEGEKGTEDAAKQTAFAGRSGGGGRD